MRLVDLARRAKKLGLNAEEFEQASNLISEINEILIRDGTMERYTITNPRANIVRYVGNWYRKGGFNVKMYVSNIPHHCVIDYIKPGHWLFGGSYSEY